MKQVLININSAIIRRGNVYLSGIGRTTYELVNALGNKEELPISISLYSQNITGNYDNIKVLPFKKIQLPLPRNDFFLNLITKLRVKEIISSYDLFHIPHNFEKVVFPEKTVLTLHDAMFFSYPEDFLGHEFARSHYPSLARSCKSIVTCSQSSKSDIVNYMNISPDKISVIPWGVSHDVFYPENKKILESYLANIQLKRPYFMMVSCDEGRKNTISLLKSFRLFLKSKPEHDLVLVWNNPPEKIYFEFASEIRNKRIHFIKGVDDCQLRCLYTGATASFFPSKYEGFGLPVVESMACGTPVVTAMNSSLSEVGGEVAFYTDPDNLEQMADYMRQFEEKVINADLERTKSIAHAAKFDWSVTADMYIKFYQHSIV